MTLALFDLDKTLIAGDSDFLWGEFLSEVGAVDAVDYQQQNRRFFDQYTAGDLDIFAYLAFCLQPLAQYSLDQLTAWREQFIASKIEPLLLDEAQRVVDEHKRRGERVLVITATNNFVVEPIIKRYGIDEFLATQAQFSNGRFSGKVEGVPCFREGKVERLQTWLDEHNETLAGASFYSDSHNDLPLLNLVDCPITVNADNQLIAVAQQKGWQQLTWY